MKEEKRDWVRGFSNWREKGERNTRKREREKEMFDEDDELLKRKRARKRERMKSEKLITECM